MNRILQAELQGLSIRHVIPMKMGKGLKNLIPASISLIPCKPNPCSSHKNAGRTQKITVGSQLSQPSSPTKIDR